MQIHINSEVEAEIYTLMESGDFVDLEDVVAKAVHILFVQQKKLAWLRAELAIGEEQERRGKLIDFTPERLEEIKRRAIENVRLGKPIKDAVKP
jgi:Arc/MetJ-type ribon-helix-helix transcriptional regulator